MTTQHTCPICGGNLIGDGYSSVVHCENVDAPIDVEPDADVIYCTNVCKNCNKEISALHVYCIDCAPDF